MKTPTQIAEQILKPFTLDQPGVRVVATQSDIAEATATLAQWCGDCRRDLEQMFDSVVEQRDAIQHELDQLKGIAIKQEIKLQRAQEKNEMFAKFILKEVPREKLIITPRNFIDALNFT